MLYDKIGTSVIIQIIPTILTMVTTGKIVIVAILVTTATTEATVRKAVIAQSTAADRIVLVVMVVTFARITPKHLFGATLTVGIMLIAAAYVIFVPFAATVTTETFIIAARLAVIVITDTMRIFVSNVFAATTALNVIFGARGANGTIASFLSIVAIDPLLTILTFDTVAELFVTIGTSAAVGIFAYCGRAAFTIER